jgi:hypothetical protein
LFWQAANVWLTVDEPVHIMAGAEYWHLRGVDHNPEHPILGKLIMTLPLLGHPIRFPEVRDFRASIPRADGRQPDIARVFMDANAQSRPLFLARVGAGLLTLFFVFIFWYGIRRSRGPRVAALATIFLATSPTVLGQGYLVTTDVGAALGVVLVLFALTSFLQRQTWPNVWVLALSFGFAFTVKYSTLILLPYASLAAVAWATSQYAQKDFYLGRFCLKYLSAVLFTICLIWFLYTGVGLGLSSPDIGLYVPPDVKWQVPFTSVSVFFSYIGSSIFFLRPLSYFASGALIGFYRSSQVGPTYFLGHVVTTYNPWYFPTVYFIKEQIWFHVLSIVAFFVGCRAVIVNCYRMTCSNFVKKYTLELLVVGFIFCYGFVAVNSGLNIGIRHLLPIIPLLAFIVAKTLVYIFDQINAGPRLSRFIVRMLLCIIIFLQVANTVAAGPLYLPFSNAIFGGRCRTGGFRSFRPPVPRPRPGPRRSGSRSRSEVLIGSERKG